MLEMAVGGDEVGAGLHGMRGEPRVVCWDGTAFVSQGSHDPGVAISRDRPNGNECHAGAVQHGSQISKVLLEARAAAKPGEQLTDDDCREKDFFGPSYKLTDLPVSCEVVGIGIGVEQEPHFHISSSIVSNSLSAASNSSAWS